MKILLIVLSFVISTPVFSQNITNTIGTNGVFTIKDTANVFLTLNQFNRQVKINGSLRLDDGPGIGGIMYMASGRFLHEHGFGNTFLGSYSGNLNMDGFGNTGLGYYSLTGNTSGSGNTAVGNYSLNANDEGNYNTALGYQSLMDNGSGSKITAIGYESLDGNTSGIENTALGYSTGTIVTTGSNLTLIGYNAEPTSATAINQITLGNNQISSLRCNVQTITSLSDARDKKNISDLSLGLDFLMKIKPRLFNWDKREWYGNNTSDGSKMKEEPTAGFIAQELDEVQTTENAEWLNLVLKDNPEKLEATYGNLLPVMVKAIQELKVESEKLKVENKELKNENEKLSSDVQSLKSMNEKLINLEKIVDEMSSTKQASLNEIKTTSIEGVEK